MKRTPLKRKTAMKQTASKRLDADRPLDCWCELRLAVCRGRATQRHERLRRSQGGTGDPANTMDLCSACHQYVHDNVAWAYANGHLIRSST